MGEHNLPGRVAEKRAERLRQACKDAAGANGGFIAVLLDPEYGEPIMATSFRGSRELAQALRHLATRLDGRTLEIQDQPKETTDA